jgi:hypothetical protein
MQYYREANVAGCFEEEGSWAHDCFVDFVALLATDDNEVGIVTGFEEAKLYISIGA